MVLFAEAFEQQLLIIINMLNKFSLASGHKINFHKSGLFLPSTVSLDVAEHLSHIFGIQLTHDLGRYFDVPALPQRVDNDTFSYILDHMR